MTSRFGWQFVHPDGSLAVPLTPTSRFDAAFTFHDGVANVRVGDSWGMIDREANFVFDPIFEQVWPSFHERAAFKVNGRWGFLTPRGEVAIEPTFLEVKNFTRKWPLTIVRTEKGWGAMRVDGVMIVPAELDGIAIGPDGWIRVVKGGLAGFCDETGKPVVDFKFRGVDFFHDDRAVARIDDKLGFVDRRGEIVIAPEYDAANDFSGGLALVKKGDRFGFVDPSGRVAIPIDLAGATSFAEGRAFVWRAGSERAECIDASGARVFDAFVLAAAFDGGTARVGASAHGPFGLCDASGALVLPMEYQTIDALAGGHRRVGKTDSARMQYGFVDASGAITCAPKFADATVVEEGVAAVQTDVDLPSPPSVTLEVTTGDEPPRLRLSRKQLEMRTRFQPRPALVDRVVAAARDRAALKRILKDEATQREATTIPFFVLSELGANGVLALEVMADATRKLQYPFSNASIVAALDAIDSRESAFARARVFGAIVEPERNVGRALRALASVALHKDVGARASAGFARISADHPGAVRALLGKLEGDEADAVRSVAREHGIDMPEMDAAQIPAQLRTPSKKKKLPEFWDARVFARPLSTDRSRALPLSAVDEIAGHLDAGDLDAGALKAACDACSLRDFAWSVFTAWLQHQAPPKEKWAFSILGDLGDDEIVARLEPLIAEWPGQSAHARAVIGLAVLGKLGTDAALRAVHKLSQRAKFAKLKGEAQSTIARIAKLRGLTSEELADQLVPDLELDEPRSFRVAFDETLKPFVVAPDGTRSAEPPKSASAEEKAFWKTLKKEARAIASFQIERLELAMATRRTWRAGAFRASFVEHPLLRHLAQRLVWRAQDGRAFRVAEDGTLASERDEKITLEDDAVIAIAHPIDLGKDAVGAWSKIFADYEILQPFAQLAREIFTLTPEEDATREMKRFENVEVRANALVGLLTHGWSRGEVGDHGVYVEIEHPLATLRFKPGLAVGTSANPNQKLEAIRLVPKDAAIDPFAFSELVHTLLRVKRVE